MLCSGDSGQREGARWVTVVFLVWVYCRFISFNKSLTRIDVSGKRAASRGAGLNVSGPAKEEKGREEGGGLQAAKDTNDSVRGAPHDSMRHATYGLVEQQTGARRNWTGFIGLSV